MALARETVRLGLGARGKAKIKVRQPLGEAVVVAAGREREAIEGLAEIVREELNVSRIRFVAAADELGSYEVKANYRSLGPVFGSEMPLAAEAIAALDPARVAEALRDGEQLGISVGGRDHTLSADDLILTLRPPEGYAVEREGTHAVALDLEIDEELREAGRGARGRARRPERAQERRPRVEDRIELDLDGDPCCWRPHAPSATTSPKRRSRWRPDRGGRRRRAGRRRLQRDGDDRRDGLTIGLRRAESG